MKIVHDPGDLVYYEGKPVTILGPVVRVDGVPGHHVKHQNGDLALVPAVVLLTVEAFLLQECTRVMLLHEQWESDLIVNDENTFLETLDAESYKSLLALQNQRHEVLQQVAALAKKKN